MEITITEELAKEMHNTGVQSLMDLAIRAYPDLLHKEKTWEDFGKLKGFYINSCSEINPYHCTFSAITNQNTIATKKRAEKFLQLFQLLNWVDKANGQLTEEWCDWGNGDQNKYVILGCSNEKGFYKTSFTFGIKAFLEIPFVFKTEEIREKFLKDHQTLIEEFFAPI